MMRRDQIRRPEPQPQRRRVPCITVPAVTDVCAPQLLHCHTCRRSCITPVSRPPQRRQRKPVRPPRREQILTARLLGGEALLELHDRHREPGPGTPSSYETPRTERTGYALDVFSADAAREARRDRADQDRSPVPAARPRRVGPSARRRPAGRGPRARGRGGIARRKPSRAPWRVAVSRAGVHRFRRLHRPRQLRHEHGFWSELRLPAPVGGRDGEPHGGAHSGFSWTPHATPALPPSVRSGGVARPTPLVRPSPLAAAPGEGSLRRAGRV